MAELAKLFTNTWRYIRFATANQLFMMANDFGLDYERIRSGLTFEYPRASDLPGAGFAAGPCLLKDTMQLAAFNNNNFVLGHAAMMVNEGLPLYVVSRLEKAYPLSTMTVGLLGMSFKAESDDIRSSLSYKLKRLLRFKSKEVLCTDPYVTVDSQLSPLEEVLERSDLLILSTPHSAYKGLRVDVPFIDIWGTLGNGAQSCEATGLGDRPGLQRGRDDRAVPRAHPCFGAAALRGLGGLRLAQRHDRPVDREVSTAPTRELSLSSTSAARDRRRDPVRFFAGLRRGCRGDDGGRL